MQTQPFKPNSKSATLLILEQGEMRSFDLNLRNHWTLGRATNDNTPDIPLQSKIAGRKHGEFLYVNDQLFYVDRGSINGTFHNGKKIAPGLNGRANPVMINNRDVLRIDYEDLSTPDERGVWMTIITDEIKGDWTYYSLTSQDKTIIGRNSETCDIVQPFPYISSQHAKITALNGNYYISDCDSLEGTWLNRKKLNSTVILKDKDCISICDCHFIFTGNGLIYNERFKSPNKQVRNGQVVFSAYIESKKVIDQGEHRKKELLHNIHIEIKSGELIALLGESGAGKSTLMECISGTDRSGVTGVVKLNGEDFYQNYNRLRRLIGFIPQENVVHELLPVEEELTNAARLRLPKDLSQKELNQQVDWAIQVLNLAEKKRTQIAKLSGGEQKRVNIGIELVADREILFLDEPDAGLDPSIKPELFAMLQSLAHENQKSIVAIIHDVSHIDLFDKIIMLAKVDGVGRLVYFGTPEGARRHFSVQKLDDIYRKVKDNPERYIKVD